MPLDRVSRAKFRAEDAITGESLFIMGKDITEMAEELALLRGVTPEQALEFLQRRAAEGGWEAKRVSYVTTITKMAQAKQMSDEAEGLSMTQSAVSELLVQMGLRELFETKPRSRKEALETIKIGFEYGWRAVGLPATVGANGLPRQSSLPSAPETGNVADRYQELDSDKFTERVRRLQEQRPDVPSDALSGLRSDESN